jgi:glycine cleavage system aminomethyltransferase T/NADPH-dependent 2,4-dienoyl-CoA reductase/sulfur reductase-like enzyme
MTRFPTGGQIDRTRPLRFTFDGRPMIGYSGDTLASALLANGVKTFGRSFKYHRPRGLMTAGVEEPNAMVTVGAGGRTEPNTRATDVFLYEGLTAVSQNRWPSLALDAGALLGLAAPFIPAGFYYKTFLGPPGLWRIYEHFIRHAAGLGKPPTDPEPDAYEQRAAFCDVLVVGAGPAGLAAALAAAKTGARVILAEQDAEPGGGLLRDPTTIDGADSADWTSQTVAEIRARGGRVLTRATAAGYWDHNLVTLAQRLTEPGQPPAPGGLAQRLWRVRAKQVVLATGAIERPLLFAGNDRPGVMLSQAARTYLTRFGILPGRRVVIATCNDDAHRTALALADAGAEIVAILDSRPGADSPIVAEARVRFDVRFDATVTQAKGGAGGLTGVTAIVAGAPLTLAADLLAVSGGFSPVVHLHMQAGGTLAWDEGLGAFRPDAARQRQTSVGAAAGEDGAIPRGAAPPPHPAVKLKTAFIDFQNDVTAADIDLAWREGYRSVEHLKRYTTLGMATDQGKTSNIVGLTRLAAAEARPVPEVGVTTFRPPYTPTTFGVLAGDAVGAHAAPTRRLPLQDTHVASGAVWQPAGYWKRPRSYPRTGETLPQAALREARAVRTAVGIIDVSTLAKFEIAGPDAGAFLERVCATRVANLAVGRGRYTLMLREDGMVGDDGTVWRLADQRFLLTSSSGGAERMAAQLSYVRRVLAPALKVSVIETQEHWAAAAVAGPLARGLIAELTGAEPPRHMGAARARIAGTDVLILAASFSGERAFEVYAPGHAIGPVWQALATGAATLGGGLYGLDALDLLRIEKGHIVIGAEADGRTTPRDLGLHKMLRPGGGYVGAQGLTRPALSEPGRLRLVGLESTDGAIPEGAMLIAKPGAEPEGHVTAAGRRVLGEGSIALALLRDGPDRIGETLTATSPTRGLKARVRVVAPVFHDPQGARYAD